MGERGSGGRWRPFRRETIPDTAGLSAEEARKLKARMAAHRDDPRFVLETMERLSSEGMPPPVVTLARSTRAAQLAALGRMDEALEEVRSAVEAARGLEASESALALLARALRIQAAVLLQVDRPGDALASAEEGLRLVREHTPGDREGLADALTRVVTSLEALGRERESLPLVEELATVRRSLGQPAPLADALDLLARLVTDAGDLDRGIAIGEDLIALRRLTGDHRGLGRALGAQSGRIADRDPRNALALADEAVRLFRRVDDRGEEARRLLATTLAVRAGLLSRLRRVDAQVEDARESLALWRHLPENRTVIATALSALGQGLLDRSLLHARVGEVHAALIANAEALEVLRELDRVAPSLQPDARGRGLADRGLLLASAGRFSEAVAVAEEAIVLLRELAPHPGRDYELASALDKLATILLGVERSAEAIAPAREAAEIGEGLSAQDPDRMTEPFAGWVNRLGVAYLRSGQIAEAHAMVEWAEQLLDGLPDDQTGRRQRVRADNADAHSHVLDALGDRDGARQNAERAVAFARVLVLYEPGEAGLLARLEDRLATLCD